MSRHGRVVSREEWLVERRELLELEKAHKRASDALAKQRRQLARVEITADYTFDGPDGEVTLEDLFGDCDTLVVYHFMFGADWDNPCKSCSFWADHFDGSRRHLERRDVRLIAVSIAPRSKIVAAAERAGWTFPWYSSEGSTFNTDFGVTFEKGADVDATYNYKPAPEANGEMPGMSVFIRGDNNRVFHTYSAFARGLEPMNSTYGILDLAPRGRDEDDLAWPMEWVKRLADLAQ